MVRSDPLVGSVTILFCGRLPSLFVILLILTVLHPYFKMDYIEHEWGGAEEQAKEIAEGNPFAINWHQEAMDIVEAAVCSI